MKKCLILILAFLLMVFSLTSCNWFQIMFDKYHNFMQPYYDDMELSIEYARLLVLAVGNDDFETAKKYLHPELSENENILERKIYTLEDKYDLDFSNGVVIKNTIGTSISVGTNDSEYALGFSLLIGEEEFQLYFVATRNNNGFGISNITQYRPQGI